ETTSSGGAGSGLTRPSATAPFPACPFPVSRVRPQHTFHTNIFSDRHPSAGGTCLATTTGVFCDELAGGCRTCRSQAWPQFYAATKRSLHISSERRSAAVQR